MWSPGLGGRKCHHEFRRFVGSVGNLWGLDAGLNRALGDKMPSAKFDQIDKWATDHDPRLWARDQWWLEAVDIAEFRSIGDALEDETSADLAVDLAMQRFHSLVTARARRLVEEVFTKYPIARLFASDAVGPATSVRAEVDIAAALGIKVPEKRIGGAGGFAPMPDSSDDRLERIIQRAGTGGPRAAVRRFIARVRALGLHVRPYEYSFTVTPPQAKNVTLIWMTPDEQTVETGLDPGVFGKYFPQISSERFERELEETNGL